MERICSCRLVTDLKFGALVSDQYSELVSESVSGERMFGAR